MKITTLRTVAGTNDCPVEGTCVSMHDLDLHPERRYVIVKRETDPAIVAAFAHLTGSDEVLGYTPRDFFGCDHG